MLFIGITLIYTNKMVYLFNAILAIKYFVINI